ncbi:mechanosensitive ion channel family protein [Methanothermococcus okinawensis]|uniref:MscS Mechanosensitive ion channel n=1 Tax=Methanothermococcus okinawensis (strain DSM 14208 / JCM 11175 / IH1) TaxID=647113 RepID=F8AMJ2_METOI|nr:mechanosensitive ion channel family protein [Methanothermococcus okinawensis]AEH06032.1 MscS Mechanosensitive ion channel [Methanothermococcus okinawensis IH1]
MINRSLIFNTKILVKIIILFVILYYLGTKLDVYNYIFTLREYSGKIIILMVLILGTLIFLDISMELIRKFFEKKGDLRDYPMFSSVVKYIIWTITGLIAISTLYKGIGSLVMSLGLIGAALTFSLQRPIMNFAGWIYLIIMRPFKINDRICIKDIGIGDVYKIDIMHIYLREVDNEPTGRNLTIPNAYVLTNALINYTRGSLYIWDYITVGITYESDWRKSKKLIFEACNDIVGDTMQELAEVWKNKPRLFARAEIIDKPIIRMKLLDSAIEIKVRYLVDAFKCADIKTKIIGNILAKFEKEDNVEIAYPHLEVIHRPKKENNNKINDK